ncbi:exportin-7-B-like [Neltuma alba]|uniref:exportin-7-B-like n=1 Tax=Neltuma alba TaxID=207710 RepID=UPI0010A4832F|nr:exportin-7-B-like [Prosopis alba]
MEAIFGVVLLSGMLLQLSEVVNAEGYSDWIRLVAEFTLKSLHSWKWAGSSVYYLLGLWSRSVTSVKYLKSDKPILLDEYVPKIIEGFVTSRFDSLQSEQSDELGENPLDNVEVLQDQLEFFPYLCRYQYESCSSYLMKIVEPIIDNYMNEANAQISVGSYEISVTEGKLTWFTHIVAAILKIKQISGFSGESHEILDAEISARVLQLINITDSGLHSMGDISKQRLDRAILTFLQHLRKCYIGDHAVLPSKQLYARLSELLGLHDHLLLLNVIVGKIATNLKSYKECKEVVDHTLSLFSEMTSGFMTGKLLLKLDTVQRLISNQNGEQFMFLENVECFRSRTMFYYTVGMLVFMEDSPLKFRSSMEHLLQVFLKLESAPDAIFRSDAGKFALIGLMRDLRGIAMATNSRRTYGFLFDWLYPARMPILLKGIVHWADSPEVTTPLLKLVDELVLNKSQRLIFDSSSANGILLFREVSKLIVAYGSRILPLHSRADIYTFKYKGMSICLSILTRALSGNYVNFGVFELYGDRALVDALDIIVKMILSIPLADVFAFRKLTAAYFAFLETLFSSHLSFVLSLDKTTFMYIIGSLESGLKDLSEIISSQCASAIDHLATFYFTHVTVAESIASPAALNVAQLISDCSVLFSGMLKTLFEIVLLEDRGNQWSLSRAMLSLILISEEMFTNIKAQILASYRPDQHERLSSCFEKLMKDVTLSLDSKNRDKFSQNLTRFKTDFCANWDQFSHVMVQIL